MANRDNRLHAYSTTKQTVAPNERRRTLAYVMVLLLLLGLGGGSWYWSARPAHVQAAIADARTASKRTDVMAVEAVTEDALAHVGRQISILAARVTAVTNERTFWVVGSEGDPLLVVLGQSPSAGVAAGSPQFASGERVSLTGVLRGDAGAESLSARERAELAKTDVYLLASDVQRVR